MKLSRYPRPCPVERAAYPPQSARYYLHRPRAHRDAKEPDWLKEQMGYTDHGQPGELFHLGDDLGEKSNLYADEPGLVEEFTELLAEAKQITAR